MVLLGVVFVVFQFRQNARLIKASNEQVKASILQNKSSVATSVVERFTDDSFTVRRKTMRDIILALRERRKKNPRKVIVSGVEQICQTVKYSIVNSPQLSPAIKV